MVIKEVKPINFLFFRTEAKVSELGNLLPVSRKLFKEAVDKNLSITGPVHWHYFGFEGDENKPFTLEISLPVAEVLSDYDGEFHFKRSEPFKCVSLFHEGSWNSLPASYGKLMSFIQTHHLHPVANNREIYVNADFVHPDANVTEIQVGIK
ncbi:MAG: GyrI-like domain-containing protein [Flammeovirgaceae bacterium]|nr:GyrI-like domain-containing protein [Flammeovirgaceae bacterium]